MATAIVPVPQDEIPGVLERILTDVPPPRTRGHDGVVSSAESIMRAAARHAALVSGSLALPPGPLGMATVMPDLYLIWKIQRQMVADLFGLHGRSAELTRTHMLYCLFRHAASHIVRDVAVRAGQRYVMREMTAGALRSMLGSLGLVITQRAAGNAAGRWVPALGAAAVASYAYWDTLQVARTARRLLEPPPATD